MQKSSPASPAIRSRPERLPSLLHRLAQGRKAWAAWAGLLLGACLLYGLGLGGLDLWAPDEPRYGAIAEELRSFRHGSSGLVLLRLKKARYAFRKGRPPCPVTIDTPLTEIVRQLRA